MKIFVLLSRVPYPIEKGDKLRAFHQIRCMAAHHDIYLCALSDVDVHPDAVGILKQYCKEVHVIRIYGPGMVWNGMKAFFSGKPLQVGYFYRCSVAKKIRNLIDQIRPDHIFCQLLRVAEYVKEIPVPKTLDYQDVFSMGAKRRADTSNWWLRPFFSMEYRRLLRYENDLFDRFDNKTIISQPDRDLIPHPSNQEIVIIPNGVDHAYFHSIVRPQEFDIVFTGNMGYAPNADAAHFIAKEILPIVHHQLPKTTLLIAGATPQPKVQALQSKFVKVSGWVPDIRESYASSALFIAPMRIGTGLQNKLLEAMAMGLPCITSVMANSALGATENKEILVGRSPQDYADLIIKLLMNKEYADSIAQKGHEFVKHEYSWENSTAKLVELMSKK